MSFRIRRAEENDNLQILSLYQDVAAIPGGLARQVEEVTEEFVKELIRDSSTLGLILVLEETLQRKIVGAIHAVCGGPENLQHVMGQLTILVHPKFQSRHLGKRLFTDFLQQIQTDFSSIMRVELRARASNLKALCLYKDLGFVREGRFRSRIKTPEGDYEDGIAMVWFNPTWRAKPFLTAQSVGFKIEYPVEGLEFTK